MLFAAARWRLRAMAKSRRKNSSSPNASCDFPESWTNAAIRLSLLQRPPGGGSRGPCPLKVESTQVSGYVHDFADEK
jgi:hypothetical protein